MLNTNTTQRTFTTVSILTILVLLGLSTPAFAADSEGLWIISIFERGGLVMWPILLSSIIAVGIILERGWRLRHDKVINRTFIDSLTRYSAEGDFEQALKLCQEHEDLSLSRIVRSGIRRARYGVLEVERAVELTGSHEATLLQANLRGLGVIGNLTPTLGLLGTVIGMIKAFSVISQMGAGNPNLVAAGISEALITTAAGLIVGIPTIAAYHYFKGKVDKFVFEMEEVSLALVEDIQNAITRASRRVREKGEN